MSKNVVDFEQARIERKSEEDGEMVDFFMNPMHAGPQDIGLVEGGAGIQIRRIGQSD